MLGIKYYGHTSYTMVAGDVSLLLNPGIWEGESVVPGDTDVRVIVATHHLDEAVGNATEIATNSKAWFLGNNASVEKVREQGGQPWLLHVLTPEVEYEIPGLKITPYPLKRTDKTSGERIENIGLYIELGGMRITYLGDTQVRGPFGALETDILITPIGGDGVFEVKDAVSLSIDVRPKLSIPMRWTSQEQPGKFSKYVDQFGQGIVPLVMEPGQELEVQWAAGNEFRHSLS